MVFPATGPASLYYNLPFFSGSAQGTLIPLFRFAILNILRAARQSRGTEASPMLVHCSAGIGRTGTILAIDINLDLLAHQHCLDVLGVVNHLRRQRPSMVQTAEQYACIYEVLLQHRDGADVSDGKSNSSSLDSALVSRKK